MTATRDDEIVRIDGRSQRREENREAVIDALTSFYAEGNADPAVAEIAARARLSERSLFRYFDDLDDMCRCAFEVVSRRVQAMIRIAGFGAGSTRDKVSSIVDQRTRLYEEVGAVMEIARAKAVTMPVVAEAIADNRALGRDQIRLHFSDELSRLDDLTRSETVRLVDALLSFETWRAMSRDQALEPAAIRSALCRGLAALLAPVEAP